MNNIIHISYGGPVKKISVNGEIITFEDHPYCGPVKLKKNGDPAAVQPMSFLEAVTLWYQQGKRMEGDLCRWDHEPEPIFQHMGGPHWKYCGQKPAIKGQ